MGPRSRGWDLICELDQDTNVTDRDREKSCCHYSRVHPSFTGCFKQNGGLELNVPPRLPTIFKSMEQQQKQCYESVQKLKLTLRNYTETEISATDLVMNRN